MDRVSTLNGRAEILQSKVYGVIPDGKRERKILYFLFCRDVQ